MTNKQITRILTVILGHIEHVDCDPKITKKEHKDLMVAYNKIDGVLSSYIGRKSMIPEKEPDRSVNPKPDMDDDDLIGPGDPLDRFIDGP